MLPFVPQYVIDIWTWFKIYIYLIYIIWFDWFSSGHWDVIFLNRPWLQYWTAGTSGPIPASYCWCIVAVTSQLNCWQKAAFFELGLEGLWHQPWHPKSGNLKQYFIQWHCFGLLFLNCCSVKSNPGCWCCLLPRKLTVFPENQRFKDENSFWTYWTCLFLGHVDFRWGIFEELWPTFCYKNRNRPLEST